MDVTILEKSFKLKKREKKAVISYFSKFGDAKVNYIDKDNDKTVVFNSDAIVYADGGWDGIYFKNFMIVNRPKYVLGFSDATYFLNTLIYNYRIPSFYGLNAYDFLDKDVVKKYPNIFEYCDKLLKSGKIFKNVIGGNLTVFNFFLTDLVLSKGVGLVRYWINGKVLFIEEGGFKVIKGDGSFILDMELDRMEQILGNKLYNIFSGVLFGGMQEDNSRKNDYLSIKQVLNKHFKGLEIKKVKCSHSEKYVNDLIVLGG